jgi:hypothetical protein
VSGGRWLAFLTRSQFHVSNFDKAFEMPKPVYRIDLKALKQWAETIRVAAPPETFYRNSTRVDKSTDVVTRG